MKRTKAGLLAVLMIILTVNLTGCQLLEMGMNLIGSLTGGGGGGGGDFGGGAWMTEEAARAGADRLDAPEGWADNEFSGTLTQAGARNARITNEKNLNLDQNGAVAPEDAFKLKAGDDFGK